MKKIFTHIRIYILRGLIALIPIALTVLVIRLLYVGIDKRVVALLNHYFGYSIPGLGIILVVIVLYIIGRTASNVAGRQFFGIIENITKRLPIINTTYQIGKQLSDTLSLPERQVFKKAVLVELFKKDSWVVGFVTGKLKDKRNNGEIMLKIYVPTPPNPTSGFLLVVKENEVRDPGWTIEEAMRVVLSGGIIGPDSID